MADGSVVFTTELDMSGLKRDLETINGKSYGTSLFGGDAGLTKLGTKIGSIIGASIAISLAKSIGKTGIAFDTAMSQVAATMGTTVENIQPLQELAKISGQTTQFTAVQAAEALNYMALAGWDVETILEGFPQMLNLAAAGAMDLAYASDIVTDGLTAMGLTASDAGRFVDEMAKTASRSNTSVSQLGEGILAVGGTAQILSGGTTELNTALGLLADNGIKASMGGTQLRNIILSLAAPIDKASEELDALNVSAYDSQGNFRPLVEIFSDLNKATQGMSEAERTQAISKIFNREDMKGVNALLNTSSERWNELNGYILEAAGSAEKMAAVQLDNLGGDILLFNSAVEGLKLGAFRPFEGVAREVVQAGTDIVNATNELFFNENKWDQLAERLGLLEEAGVHYDGNGEMRGGGYGRRFGESEEGFWDKALSWIIPKAGAAEAPSDVSSVSKEMANAVAADFQESLLESFQAGEITYDQLVAAAFGGEGGEGTSATGGEAGSQMMSIANGIIAELSAGLTQAGTEVSGAITSIISSAGSAASGMASNFRGVGYQIAAGMAAGVRQGGGMLSSAVTSIIKSALQAGKRAAMIKSPSRLFRDEIGEFIATGTAEGVENNAVALRKAVNNMVMNSMPDMRDIGKRAAAMYSPANVSGVVESARASVAGNWTQNNTFNVPVQTPDEFAQTMRQYATYGLQG